MERESFRKQFCFRHVPAFKWRRIFRRSRLGCRPAVRNRKCVRWVLTWLWLHDRKQHETDQGQIGTGETGASGKRWRRGRVRGERRAGKQLFSPLRLLLRRRFPLTPVSRPPHDLPLVSKAGELTDAQMWTAELAGAYNVTWREGSFDWLTGDQFLIPLRFPILLFATSYAWKLQRSHGSWTKMGSANSTSHWTLREFNSYFGYDYSLSYRRFSLIFVVTLVRAIVWNVNCPLAPFPTGPPYWVGRGDGWHFRLQPGLTVLPRRSGAALAHRASG